MYIYIYMFYYIYIYKYIYYNKLFIYIYIYNYKFSGATGILQAVPEPFEGKPHERKRSGVRRDDVTHKRRV